MAYLEKLLSLDPAIAQALTGLAYAGALFILALIIYKIIKVRQGNNKGNGIGEALGLDERVAMLEKQSTQIVTGLEFINKGFGEVKKTTGRLDREMGVITERINNLVSQLNSPN